MAEERDTRVAVIRGLKNRCPNCGEGRLLRGYLTNSRECEVCKAPLGRYPAADGPAFFTMTIVFLLLIPLFGSTWVLSRPSPAGILVTVGSISIFLSFVLLRLVKGAFIGYLWAIDEQDRGS